jgi:enterochelin esterase-like enzyme
VLEPQGAGFFLLLMVVFGGLLVWVALARQLVFRVLAACLAFLPAMVFGVAAVNKFYDYYQTWGGMINDLTSQSNLPKYAAGGNGTNKQFDKNIGRVTNQAEDAEFGYLFQTSVTGARSHLTRDVYVYLPPQYFRKAYRHYKFPVIELLHGSPGGPRAWVNVMGVIPTFLSLLGTHPDDAAVLVMPDTDGSPRYGLQCLNNPGGIQDMTFVARDVPDAIARIARVQPPGRAWGVAGYSEGGYCAANIGVQEGKWFGAAGVLSGYFAPIKSQVPAGNKPGGRPLTVNVFLGHPGLKLVNTPRYYVTRLPVNDQLPVFWLAVGAEDTEDVSAAQYFRQVLQTRMVNVPLMVVPGGGHQASVWREALGPMLRWMTPQLAGVVKQADAAAARKAHDGKPRRPHAATASRKP